MNKKKMFWVVAGTAFMMVFGVLVYSKYQKSTGTLIDPRSSGLMKIENLIESTVAGEIINDAKGATTVAVYNGTAKIGLTGKFVKDMSEKFGIKISVVQNASKKDYPRSFVVDINNKATEMAKKVAFQLDCPLVSIMPDKEVNPGTDVLVILGGDYR